MTGLIAADHLGRRFGGSGLFGRGRPVQAVTDVSLAIDPGEAVGLVGESGSGKSTIGRLLLGLLAPTEGRVMLEGADLGRARGPALRRLRRRMQLVFQDPYASLDPRRRIGAQIADGLAIHKLCPRSERRSRTEALLLQVGLPAADADRFPHEFSGGQRQRVGIARALATRPAFLVADEPVSALDVSVQAQVLALLADLRSRLGLGMLFISHDLHVVRSLCDRVVVLYLGRIMEQGPAAEVLQNPRHPYTRALLSAAPSLDPMRRRSRILLPGDPPSPADPPSGCVFRTRCPWAVADCGEAVPPPNRVGPHHEAACIRVGAGVRLPLPDAIDTSPEPVRGA
ncbi:ABC transporter ATP-binding protein [Rhodopila sp.]|uniref:ABC transporter ATP-binding protein n=1 Tax=Rhodopila sp. TaxID=2480087 RepID=UPI003D0CDE35